MAPDVFELGKDNELKLQDHHRLQPPWKAVPHHRRKDITQAWLYCSTCHKLLENTSAEKDQPPLPFRDEASLDKLRGVDKATLRKCKAARDRAAQRNPAVSVGSLRSQVSKANKKGKAKQKKGKGKVRRFNYNN